MQQGKIVKALSVAVLTLGCSVAFAQDLTLFEAVETPANVAGATAEQSREQRNLPNTPTFTLLGTSRIGDRRRVSLVDSAGKVIVVEIGDAESTPIPEHDGYSIVSVDSRRVTISQPAGMPCLGASELGVQCGADGQAELSLTTAAPIAVANAAAPVDAGQQEAINGDTQAAPDNPFAAALRAAAQNEANAQNGRGRRGADASFEARRIPDEDVPPGMRKVRTPFGDRLVEL